MTELNSLRDLVKFTGVLSTAGLGVNESLRRGTLDAVGRVVPGIADNDRRSLGRLIQLFRNAPAFDLQVEIIGATSGFAPFVPEIKIAPGVGLIVETVINYFHDGVELPPGPFGRANGNDASPGHLTPLTWNDPGGYQAAVARTGIGPDGVMVLVKWLSFGVRTPASPDHPPVQAIFTGPTCQIELSSHAAISSSVTSMRVFGGGFQAGEDLQIVEGLVVLGVVAADVLGGYSADVDFLHGLEPSNHRLIVIGTLSGLKSNTAGFVL